MMWYGEERRVWTVVWYGCSTCVLINIGCV